MDVIVDSNILASDPLMRTPRFAALFDYLRRTDSTLVVLDPVKEEVLARFKRELKRRSKESRFAWDSLQELIYTQKQFAAVDFSREIKLLDQRLSPASSNVTLYEAQVDLREVVKRGARRIRPANDQGEELRDVIIWLMALKFAEQRREAVAFVSGDSGFWNGETPHDVIMNDISLVGVSITLYKDVERLLHANTLKKTKITAAGAKGLIDLKEFYPAILERAQDQLATNVVRRWEALEIKEILLTDGAIYDISSVSRFAELLYTFKVLCSEILPERSEVEYPSPAAYPSIDEWLIYRRNWSHMREREIFEGIVRLSVRIANGKVEKAELDVWVPFSTSDPRLFPSFRFAARE